MRYTPTFAAVLAASLAATTVHAQPAPSAPAAEKVKTARLSEADKAFLQEAGQGATYELAMAHLAERQAHKPEVKEYARTVANDHKKLNGVLLAVARQGNYELSIKMNQRQQDKLKELEGLNGERFDQEYLRETKRVNLRDQAELAKVSDATENPGIKDLVQQMKAADAKHEQMANKINV